MDPSSINDGSKTRTVPTPEEIRRRLHNYEDMMRHHCEMPDRLSGPSSGKGHRARGAPEGRSASLPADLKLGSQPKAFSDTHGNKPTSEPPARYVRKAHHHPGRTVHLTRAEQGTRDADLDRLSQQRAISALQPGQRQRLGGTSPPYQRAVRQHNAPELLPAPPGTENASTTRKGRPFVQPPRGHARKIFAGRDGDGILGGGDYSDGMHDHVDAG